MKNNKLSFAIMTMALAAAISVAVVSCKKETENALQQKAITAHQAFDISKIHDIDTYLCDFKKKMRSATKSLDETMELEEAAWHLASVANRDFCNANVEYNDYRYDTISTTIQVNEGQILLSDLYESYLSICSDIETFQSGLALNNQHLRFINVSIDQTGQAQISMITTFNSDTKSLEDHLWYFPDTFGYMDSICDYFFDLNTNYLWNGGAKTLLNWIINTHEGVSYLPYVMYYVPTRYYLFDYPNWMDPYGSPFLGSRLFAMDDNYLYNLNSDEMCYCLDSYLGLECDYLTSNYYVDDEIIVNSTIICEDSLFENHKTVTYYHILGVQYGLYVKNNGEDPNPNN